VQRRLGVRPGEARVDGGARGDQHADLGRGIGHLSGPVGDDVQQRPGLPALGVTEPGVGKFGMLA
jgi:hypothetical protein